MGRPSVVLYACLIKMSSFLYSPGWLGCSEVHEAKHDRLGRSPKAEMKFLPQISAASFRPPVCTCPVAGAAVSCSVPHSPPSSRFRFGCTGPSLLVRGSVEYVQSSEQFLYTRRKADRARGIQITSLFLY